MPQEILKHVAPDCLVRSSDLFPLDCKKKKKTKKTIIIAIQFNKSKLCQFLSDWQKLHFLVCHKILVICLCVLQEEKDSKSLASNHKGVFLARATCLS